jgi:hypothetical protein
MGGRLGLLGPGWLPNRGGTRVVQLCDRDADAVAEIPARFAEVLETGPGEPRADAIDHLVGRAGETVSAWHTQAKHIRAIADEIKAQRGAPGDTAPA